MHTPACCSPAGEDSVLQAGGLAAEPSALVAGRTAAGQGGAGRREGGDEQAAQRRCRTSGGFRDNGREQMEELGG